MKRYLYILIALATAACTQEKTGKGDAAIGFAKTEYTVSEDVIHNNVKGIVRLPLRATGEPMRSPAKFDLQVLPLEGIENLSDIVLFTQTEGLQYAGIASAAPYVEFKILDNDNVDASVRKFLINIVNAENTAVTESSATITIEDDEFNADPKVAYPKLEGDWIVTANGLMDYSTTYSFEVNISGGFSASEIAANLDKRLVVWGFFDMKDIHPGANPEHQPVWYLEMGEKNNISITTGTVITDKADVDLEEGGGHYDDLKAVSAAYFPVDPDKGASSKGQIYYGTSIPGTWSRDYNTIQFDNDYAFGAMLVIDDKISDYTMVDFISNIVMTRKK